MSFENAVVSFRHPTLDETIDGVEVRIVPTTARYNLTPFASDYRYAISWEDARRFSDDTPIGEGVVMTLDGKDATLERVTAPFAGSMSPRWRGFFNRAD